MTDRDDRQRKGEIESQIHGWKDRYIHNRLDSRADILNYT